MYGNFVTLTNVNKEDLNKIIKYKLEPLYISVHSLNDNIREILFGNKKNICGISNLKFLDKNGVKSNIQIVLCPGINDEKDLENTLFTLINDYKNILSIGIVPVGITKFNKECNLKSYNKKSAIKIINFIDSFKKYNRSLKKAGIIYLSDEFYIMSGIRFPEYKCYGNFYQIENGIGKSVFFLKQIKDFIGNYSTGGAISFKTDDNTGHILLLTSEYGEIIIKNALDIILRKSGNNGKRIVPSIKIMKVTNQSLGGNIKITGLLSGEDIISNLKRENIGIYNKILIPDCIFNKESFTIDNYTKQDIVKISKNIKIISENGYSFIKEIFYK